MAKIEMLKLPEDDCEDLKLEWLNDLGDFVNVERKLSSMTYVTEIPLMNSSQYRMFLGLIHGQKYYQVYRCKKNE